MSGNSDYEAPAPTSGYPSGPGGRVQTGWVGWIVFAGVMLVLLGIFHLIQGLVALFRDEVYLVGKHGLIVNVDYTAWGWVHVVGGLVAVLAGFCLMRAQLWARILAVVVALLSAVINVAFLPAYPLWSAMMIAIDVLVIWAVIVHGAEMRTPEWEAESEVPG
jgi:hypothetical protein